MLKKIKIMNVKNKNRSKLIVPPPPPPLPPRLIREGKKPPKAPTATSLPQQECEIFELAPRISNLIDEEIKILETTKIF